MMTDVLNRIAEVSGNAFFHGLYALLFLAMFAGWIGRRWVLILGAVLLLCSFLLSQGAIAMLGKDYRYWTGMEGLGVFVGPLLVVASVALSFAIYHLVRRYRPR